MSSKAASSSTGRMRQNERGFSHILKTRCMPKPTPRASSTNKASAATLSRNDHALLQDDSTLGMSLSQLSKPNSNPHDLVVLSYCKVPKYLRKLEELPLEVTRWKKIETIFLDHCHIREVRSSPLATVASCPDISCTDSFAFNKSFQCYESYT